MIIELNGKKGRQQDTKKNEIKLRYKHTNNDSDNITNTNNTMINIKRMQTTFLNRSLGLNSRTTTTTMLNESHHEDDNSAHRDGKARNDNKIVKKKTWRGTEEKEAKVIHNKWIHAVDFVQNAIFFVGY